MVVATRIPEMAIEEKEADLLAVSLLRAFPRIRTIVSGETMAKLALAGVIMQIYGTRMVAIGARIRTEKAKAEKATETIIPNGNGGYPFSVNQPTN